MQVWGQFRYFVEDTMPEPTVDVPLESLRRLRNHPNSAGMKPNNEVEL